MPSVNSSEKTFPLWLQPSHYQTSKALSPCSPLFYHKDSESPLVLVVLPPSFKTPSTQVSLGGSLFPANSYRLFSSLDDHLPQGSLLLFPSSLRSGQPGHSGQATSPSNSPRETETDHRIYHELIPRIPPLQSVTLLFLVLSKVKKYRHPSCLLGPKLPTHWPTPPPQGAFQGNSSKAAHLLSYLSCSFLHRFCFVFFIMCISLLFINFISLKYSWFTMPC